MEIQNLESRVHRSPTGFAGCCPDVLVVSVASTAVNETQFAHLWLSRNTIRRSLGVGSAVADVRHTIPVSNSGSRTPVGRMLGPMEAHRVNGKTLRLYLVDGTPTGILTAEIMNWTGKVIVAPRSQMADLSRRPEVKRTGVYVLVGADLEKPNRDLVYVGEGDSVLTRLLNHDKDESKDFWTRTIVIICKDENLTKSHGRYLESRLIELTRQADRAGLANGTNPDATPLPEPDVADMEYFISQVQMVLPVLGFTFLQPRLTRESAGIGPDASPRFVLKEVGATAYAVEIGDEFVVLKGSTARKQGVESWTSYSSLRSQLVSDGKLVNSSDPAFLVFAEDVAFGSPSAGGAVVLGRNTNGRKQWRVEGTGQTYAQWHEARLTGPGAERE